MTAAFKIQKKCLLTAPILAYPRFDSDEPFVLDTDWSKDHQTIGAALSQRQEGFGRGITYSAKKLERVGTTTQLIRGSCGR
jgi:hypothetical protein